MWQCRSPRRSPGVDELGHVAALSSVELAAVLAQLGRDLRQAEPRVDLLLGRAARASRRSRRRGSPYSETCRPRRTAASRSATLCALEPVKCWSRLPNWSGVDDAQVDRACPVCVRARAPRCSPAPDALSTTSSSPSAGEQRRRVVGGRDDVEVLDQSARRRAEPASSTRIGRPGARAAPSTIALADLERLVRAARAARGALGDAGVERREHRLLELRRRSPCTSRSCWPSAAAAQRVERVDAELVEQLARALGPEARAGASSSTSPAGNFARSFSAAGIVPVSSSALDLLLERLADPGQLGDRPSRVERGDRRGRLADGLRRVAVGDDAVDDRAVELVEVAELVEERRR